jgi:DNA-binding NarL/FixJ family response regulator
LFTTVALPAEMTIRVLIADDHGVVAEGLRYVVEAQRDMEVVACVQDGHEAVRWSLMTNPDVVLMDNAMPVVNGTEAARMLHERLPDVRVIMLSMYTDFVHVARALQAGASGYVLKKSVAKEVVQAIRTVHAGKRYLSRPLVETVIDQFASKNIREDPVERLSSRERQVLQLLADGAAVADIAATLSLSPKTVDTYRARVMGKLGIRDFAGLIKFAIHHGLTSLE